MPSRVSEVVTYRLPVIAFERLEQEAKRMGTSPTKLTQEYMRCLFDEATVISEARQKLRDIEHLVEIVQQIRNRAGALFTEPACEDAKKHQEHA